MYENDYVMEVIIRSQQKEMERRLRQTSDSYLDSGKTEGKNPNSSMMSLFLIYVRNIFLR